MKKYEEQLNFLKDFANKDDFFKKITLYKELLEKFNAVHNLTHFENIDENIIDSVKILDFYDLSNKKKIIDIGSGAGFPALFLACILQDNEFFLFEPSAKKASFLRVVKTELNLINVNIIKEKLQNYPPFKVDLITSRALMDVKPLVEISNGFYDKNTLFLLYKGSEVYDELQELKDYQIFNQGFRNYCLLKIKEKLC
ncbi:16S rRNA (guanine(527)-N(7))-methyltransferase RsmG [Campylobacter sp. IFREMER_LSEM_CL292]|uniref:16S rRNA (guanine(527)-N(7))-methyltransferase RsmG n=1 Tax=Campylobacter TaxID=194 RepID=UPI0010599C07|nr:MULTISPECIES: 16S rRNA (guanine(527)-N(7))-methyltransferase RsmG [Campylobacter]EAI4441725.1 16S rRNA (guanine(527)-N(7))-methyltransferase RsmG [Campylobacter lari]EAI8624569.1 16S rRNA (guanine(527)-N(7))-methyltransferase RsmG [Campylobacter lari]EAK0812265.1 16S rRNA (guanine(527)-N(7))-methyltransferase RsmG [Campylobacter lari]EAK1250007.1 16S rRNA (guanine(527)-N(7))-methyltransferase RsmG [Campylobacter lari]EAK9889672.1 16S rRNA (guanine(527)-N(7))-methyltransferase RsmG [Campylob